MSYQVKELGVGGILDQAIKVCKDGAGVLLPITFCLMVPLQIAFGLGQLAMLPALPPDATQEEILAAQIENGPTLMVVGLVGAIAIGLFQMLTQSALIFGISDIYLGGEKPTLGSAFSRGVKRWMPLWGTLILYSLAMMAGFMLLVIPGIFVALWYYLSPTVAVLEEKAGSGAMNRSKALMKDNLSKAVAVGFLMILIGFGVGVCAGLIPQPHVAVVAQGVLAGFTTILTTAVGVVFYYSCLCQHENYDMRRLAEAVGTQEPPNDSSEPTNLGL